MKKMGKILSMGLALLMLFALAACGGETATPAVESAAPEAVEESAGEDVAEAPASETGEEVAEESAEATGDKLEAVKAAGKVVMGCSADFPPYEFYDLASDSIAGFDVSLAKEIAADMGVELEIKDFAFDTLIGAMNTGEIDMILSGMNATEERKNSVDFSIEYFTGEQSVVVRANEADSYKVPEDFEGKKVGAQSGSLQEGFAVDQLGTIGADIHIVQKIPDLVMELKTGGIAGLVLDKPIAEAFVRQHDDLTICEVHISGDDSGFAVAVPKGQQSFLDSVNATLERLSSEGKLDSYFEDAVNLAQEQEVE